MTSLGNSGWTQREDLPALVKTLGADNLRWVGGAVRDGLLGVEAKDVDAATKLPPQQVMELLAKAGIKCIPTGIEHGTVTAVLGDGHVEITTLRRDVSTDGRHATVAFAQDWQEDAARRDFTINALYAHPETLEISDYFGGREDLAARRVRFIGDARERIAEDHLRILRYYRFQARFGAALCPKAEEACTELAPMLKGLSRERVCAELLGLLALPAPYETLARMFERGVLPVILPEAGEAQIAALKRLIEAEKSQNIAPDSMRRLSAILPADPKLCTLVAARLRLSNNQKKRLISAARRETVFASPQALSYRMGHDWALDRLLVSGVDVSSLDGFEAPQFPLKGGEIVQRGVGAGPEVARILQSVETRWIDEDFPARSRVEEMLTEELAKG